ncbi:MAG: recombinase family protein [Actinomycetia bacterium]|nr:recombinase family protein [Actinomycetes bacterium]
MRFLRKDLTFTDRQTENQAIIMKAMHAFAEFERALCRERQPEGIALAKQRGVHAGRTRVLTKTQTNEIRRRASAGESKASLAREFGVNRSKINE